MKTAPLAALMLTVAGATVALAQPEVEPNNTYTQAGTSTGVPVTRTGTIAAANDVDFYAVTVPAGSSLKIRAVPTSHTCMTSDLVVSLISPAGITIVTNDDGPGMFFCPEIHPTRDAGAANLPGGTYYIGVNNINGATNVQYQLVVEFGYVASPLAPTFTYQGVLKENELPVNGPRDFTVTLWDHPVGANAENRIGTPIHMNSVDVLNGLFMLPLNFGADAFNGQERYIEIQVAYSGQGPGGTTLGPRQRLTVTPHAAYALKAAAADSATNASQANYANSANSAFQAQFATLADSTFSAPWNGITGMPAGFADGQDNAGPWLLNGFTAYYSAGAVAVGTTNAGGFTFAVNGSAAKVGGGSWSVFCDSRLKHDIKPLTGTLDKLLGLRGYTFAYNEQAVEQRLAMPGTQIGLMAEEVERVFPDWVDKDADGFRYVTERATTALMVEALRDLRAEKDAALAQKQAQIDSLTARLERLEAALKK
ncbi:MAG: hypothetical protein HBSAPP03_17960 [Phycisphaerae bacterium]|nr:MAG: hypothetical protein HBSAPP03_17960 [Phycisphaerae bacterium]